MVFSSRKVMPEGLESAMKTVELEPFVLQIWAGLCVYSQSSVSDIWLMLKNEHVFISMFLAHPKHPYNRVTRSRVTGLSCVLAYGLMCIFAGAAENETSATILSLVLGVTLQTAYDATLKTAATCSCVQHGVPVCIRDCCLGLGKIFMIVQAFIALILFIVGVTVLAVESQSSNDDDEYQPDFIAATINWVISKMSSFFFTTLATSVVLIYFRRQRQMKPARDDPERVQKLAVWNAPRSPNPVVIFFCRCLSCCVDLRRSPPCKKWKRFYGEDLDMEDLPQRAPQYDIDINFTFFGLKKKATHLYDFRADRRRAFVNLKETRNKPGDPAIGETVAEEHKDVETGRASQGSDCGSQEAKHGDGTNAIVSEPGASLTGSGGSDVQASTVGASTVAGAALAAGAAAASLASASASSAPSVEEATSPATESLSRIAGEAAGAIENAARSETVTNMVNQAGAIEASLRGQMGSIFGGLAGSSPSSSSGK